MEDHPYKPIIDFDKFDVKEAAVAQHQSNQQDWMLDKYKDTWLIFPLALSLQTSKIKFGYKVYKKREDRWIQGNCKDEKEARRVVAHLLEIENAEKFLDKMPF